MDLKWSKNQCKKYYLRNDDDETLLRCLKKLMLIRGHKINKHKYKYKLKYLHISAGIKKINDINNIYSMTNMSMNCRDDNTCIHYPLV